MVNSDVLTVSQTAEYLQICDKTVRRLISKGDLLASKVGNSWRIKKSDVDFYLKKNCNSTKEDKCDE
ncbi:MAG: helix-turn-helix domain-containing protein [Lachnospiraceae bacterium]